MQLAKNTSMQQEIAQIESEKTYLDDLDRSVKEEKVQAKNKRLFQRGLMKKALDAQVNLK